MRVFLFGLFMALSFGLFNACNDPTIIGSDLLEGEGLNVVFSDSLDIRAKSTIVDSVKTYSLGTATQTTYMLGSFEDPFIGQSNGSIYTEVHFGTSAPNYENSTLDSLVLILGFDTLGFYGDTLLSHDIEVFRMLEPISMRDSIFSNEDFEVDMMPVGSKLGYVPNRVDSLSVFDPTVDSMVNVSPQLRIRLDDVLGQEIIDDVGAAETDSAFVELLNGLYIKAQTSSPGAFVGIDIGSLETPTNLILYFTKDDTITADYKYVLTGRRFARYEHNYTGFNAEPFIDDFDMGDSLLFLQSMSGLNVEFDISDVMGLTDVLINKAELEVFIAELEGENLDIYPPVNGIIASRYSEAERLLVVEDARIGIEFGNLAQFFGGTLEEEEVNSVTVKKYNINLTTHLQRVLEGEEDPEIIISALLKLDRPNRSVIFGPGHSEYPALLRIAYTTL